MSVGSLRPDAAPERLPRPVGPGRPLRLGTRASALATSQSEWVADRLRAAGHPVELVLVRTEGDVSRASLSVIGGTGVFASALREALHEGRIDLAVHSLKDLPTSPEPGLVVAAVPEREDPRDVLVARDGLTLADLPAGSVVGTGSPRRAAQLAVARPDLTVRDIRGNVGTRIDLVRTGELDAVVLARAGLARLGRLDEVSDVLDLATMLPAAGQGALAVECRDGEQPLPDGSLPPGTPFTDVPFTDADLARLLAESLEHPPTRAAVTAERAVLARLEAGCTAPVGALATVRDGHGIPAGAVAAPDGPEPAGPTLALSAFVALQDSPQRLELTGHDPVDLGHAVADDLLNRLDPGTARADVGGAPGSANPGV